MRVNFEGSQAAPAEAAATPARGSVECFVDLAEALRGELDVGRLLHLLVEECAELAEATDVGLLLVSPSGRLRAAASSSERMHELELFEIERSEGPCLEVLQTGSAVLNGSLGRESRWPRFATRARAAGYRLVHALPMRHGRDLVGVVNLFNQETAALPPGSARIAQALADLVTFAILQSSALHEATDRAGHLERALRSRVLIEQAKGVISERLAIDIGDAFAVLRDYSRNANQHITEVARHVVERELAAEVVLEGARRPSSGR